MDLLVAIHRSQTQDMRGHCLQCRENKARRPHYKLSKSTPLHPEQWYGYQSKTNVWRRSLGYFKSMENTRRKTFDNHGCKWTYSKREIHVKTYEWPVPQPKRGNISSLGRCATKQLCLWKKVRLVVSWKQATSRLRQCWFSLLAWV